MCIRDSIKARDHQDMSRATSPLVRTNDAVYIDTTEMSPEEVIARLLTVTQGRIRVISQP